MIRILIVSDSIETRLELRRCIPPGDPHVRIAGETSNPDVGLTAVRDMMPDIVVVDADMTPAAVEDFCRNVYSDFPWLRIVRVTNHDILHTPFEWGDATLLRPVVADDLHAVLKREYAKIHTIVAFVRARILDTYRISEKRLEIEHGYREWLYGRGACPDLIGSHGRYKRILRVYGQEEDLRSIDLLMHRAEKGLPTGLKLCVMSMPDSELLMIVGNDEMVVEEHAYRVAYDIYRTLERMMGIHVKIAIGNTVTEITPECLPDMPCMAIQGAGDRPGALGTPPKTPTPAGELLMSADESSVSGIMEYCRKFACDSRQEIERAYRDVVCEVTGMEPDYVPDESSEALLRRAIRIRDEGVPGLKDHPVSLIRGFLCRVLSDAKLDPVSLTCSMNISRSRVRVVFAQYMGITSSEYHMRMRCRLTESLMRNTSRRISTIAAQTGCPDAEHLVDWYRRLCGYDPRELRKK